MNKKKQDDQFLSLIHELSNSYPDDFLTIDSIRIDNKHVYVGIFKCALCNKPILHPQYAFCRLCGSCDLGKKPRKWTIIKPKSIEMAHKI